MPTEKPTFSPVSPVPISNFFNAESRIRDLREMLLDKSLEFQKENILFAIHLYETGQLPPKRECDTTWILNGKVVDQLPDDLPKGSVIWGERLYAMQLLQTTQTPQAIAFQMGHSTSYGLFAGNAMHEIFARFRLVPILGGNPNIVFNVSIANDTGSDMQTIFTTDLINLHYNPNTYQGRMGFIPVATANGVVAREWIIIEIQLMKANGTIASPWFRESALVTPIQPGPQYRLSGIAMCNRLYFATAPGNTTLFISEKKNGIVTQLPAV